MAVDLGGDIGFGSCYSAMIFPFRAAAPEWPMACGMSFAHMAIIAVLRRTLMIPLAEKVDTDQGRYVFYDGENVRELILTAIPCIAPYELRTTKKKQDRKERE